MLDFVGCILFLYDLGITSCLLECLIFNCRCIRDNFALNNVVFSELTNTSKNMSQAAVDSQQAYFFVIWSISSYYVYLTIGSYNSPIFHRIFRPNYYLTVTGLELSILSSDWIIGIPSLVSSNTTIEKDIYINRMSMNTTSLRATTSLLTGSYGRYALDQRLYSINTIGSALSSSLAQVIWHMSIVETAKHPEVTDITLFVVPHLIWQSWLCVWISRSLIMHLSCYWQCFCPKLFRELGIGYHCSGDLTLCCFNVPLLHSAPGCTS